MQDIVDFIKGYDNSENYITITSIKSGDGYFAPSAMLAAYHCSPILRIGDMPGNPAGMADQIESGIVWVNCWLVRDLRTPFGGMKQSGVGREGGFEALEFFTEEKNVCINILKKI